METNSKPAESQPPWPLVEWIILHLPQYQKGLVGAGYREQNCVKEYFVSLQERRAKAIRYADTDALAELTFVGNRHLEGTPTPEFLALVRRSQEATWQHIQKNSGSVILVEDASPHHGNKRITRALAIESLRQELKAAGRKGDPQRMFESNWSAQARAIRAGEIVISGEEWLGRAEGAMRRCHREILHKVRPVGDDLLKCELIWGFTRLRSELAVIRALEALERMGKDRAVIIQGAGHGPHMPEIGKVYGLTINVVYAAAAPP